MDINTQTMLFQFIGGLGIFLFGIKYMGDGLQNAAGDRLREILEKSTSNPFMGVLSGILVTILIQSSSGTTALTVGLVNAGFMTFRQAIGVIMGANIGTTVTAFIIGIKVGEYALPIMGVGAALLFFLKGKKTQSFGQVMFGFGALFLGLEFMSDGMKPLRSLEVFRELTVTMSDNPILGVVIGTAFTVLVQSSSATIGILQELFGEGAMTLQAALPVLFGDNIGTTITAVLASIGTSVAARRAATVHVMFNIIGTVIFLIIIKLYTQFISYLQGALDLNPEMTIAFAHGIFNVSNTIIQFPFIALIALLVTKIVRGDDTTIDYKPQNLDPMFIEKSPSIALGQASKEIVRMADLAGKGLEETFQYLNTNQKKHSDMAIQIEEALNSLDRKITSYLVDISAKPLTPEETGYHATLLDYVRDLERVGDHMENIVELIDYRISNRVSLSENAISELNEMASLTLSTLNDAIKSIDTLDTELAKGVLSNEEKIDKMERVLRKGHILRLNEGRCSGDAGIIFVDIVSNLERIGDHAVNLAEGVLGLRHQN
ncbi:phosphate:Na+ symporter [Bacillus mesophilus]|uniref:Na/Pi cotransporter family protein n=2 Tax=Bacillus mesophilus TaxID=1808955 RepID=A0A6M0QBX2_9BACI|nr:Na/Pi cotransporter family protein [Bacillus mesophilus]MBM7660113.1 phosphate:Na+ symporter [Bacillus mesophilus]NEY73767.1 Na/Pi cotransporter family protein [Bacillus mesophilus]